MTIYMTVGISQSEGYILCNDISLYTESSQS